jgi:hypothetical protein
MSELPLEADERLVRVYDRALSAKIPCGWYVRGVRSSILKLRLPDGADGLVVDLGADDADRFARVPFERVVLLGKYLAHWDGERGEIVAGVNVKPGFRSALKSIPGFEELSGENEIQAPARLADIEPSRVNGRLTFPGSQGSLSAVLQVPPPEELFFCGEQGAVSAALRIEGAEPGNASEAARLLFDVSHAIFFELDKNYAVSLQLSLRNASPQLRMSYPRAESPDPLGFPRLRFPRDAVALYMHARTASMAPLTEYLTYYQVIEHCMTALARPDIVRRLRDRLSAPSFDLNDDVALSELLVQPGRSGQSGKTEREQIRLAVSACVTPDSIQELLRSDESLASFVSDPDTELGGRPIEVQGSTANLPRQLADRIYDLRCRIVHAKGNAFDEAGSPLLPFNADVDLLRHDLRMVRFAAQQVLLTAAVPTDT